MTYHRMSCPYCKKSLGTETGSPDRIGNPFKKCPRCGGIYVDKFTREWVNRSPSERKIYAVKIPLTAALAILVGLTIVLFAMLGQSWGNSALGASIGISAACAVAVFCIIFFIRRPRIRKAIEQSLERTKYESYVQELQKANLKIYPIEGVEIGTIKDVVAENVENAENTSSETSDSVA